MSGGGLHVRRVSGPCLVSQPSVTTEHTGLRLPRPGGRGRAALTLRPKPALF